MFFNKIDNNALEEKKLTKALVAMNLYGIAFARYCISDDE